MAWCAPTSSAALKGEPITAWHGDQSRCFGHVFDAVEASPACSTRLMPSAKSSTSATMRLIYGLAEKIKQKTGSKSQIVKSPIRKSMASASWSCGACRMCAS
jgi:hypothetical protein